MQVKHQIAVFLLFYAATNGLGALKLSLSPSAVNPRYATAWSVVCFFCKVVSCLFFVAATWYCRYKCCLESTYSYSISFKPARKTSCN